MAKYLNQDDVTKFAKYRRLIAKAESWTKKKREEFLEQLSKGFICPKRGPWVLETTPTEGNVSWKQEFENYLTTRYLAQFDGDEQLARVAAIAKLEKIAASAERTPGIRLDVKDNEKYNTKKSAAA